MATHFLGDTAVLTGRTLRHVTRSPDTILTTAITPIAIMLLFGSELLETDADDDPRPHELADIMIGLAEQARAAGEAGPGEVAQDDLAFNLLDALVVESDPRAERLLELMHQRGWASWTRMELTRLDQQAEPPG